MATSYLYVTLRDDDLPGACNPVTEDHLEFQWKVRGDGKEAARHGITVPAVTPLAQQPVRTKDHRGKNIGRVLIKVTGLKPSAMTSLCLIIPEVLQELQQSKLPAVPGLEDGVIHFVSFLPQIHLPS